VGEAFRWHGVKPGDASRSTRAISGRGTASALLERRQLGNRRTRPAMYADSIEQLRGTAGARQVKVRAETALAAFTTLSSGGWIMFGKHLEITGSRRSLLGMGCEGRSMPHGGGFKALGANGRLCGGTDRWRVQGKAG
jgi:hypothetical protein